MKEMMSPEQLHHFLWTIFNLNWQVKDVYLRLHRADADRDCTLVANKYGKHRKRFTAVVLKLAHHQKSQISWPQTSEGPQNSILTGVLPPKALSTTD